MGNARSVKILLDEKIIELNKSKHLFFTTNLIKSHLFNYANILSRIKTTKSAYSLFLGLSIVLGGILYIAGFIQVFSSHNLLNLSSFGLIIILTFGNIAHAWRLRIDIEKLKQIAFLLELRSKIESHSI